MNLNCGGKVIIVLEGRFVEKVGVMLGEFGQDMAKRDETVEDSSGLRPKGAHEG